jgi:hypothetical protein
MKPLVLLAMIVPAFADPRIVYTKSFPGSVPAYVEIAIDQNGAVSYKEDPDDDDPDKFNLDAASKRQIFDLAAKLDHFAHPIESGLKVANMGVKTFRWEDGGEKHEVKFNYSLDDNAKELHNWFERITETENLLETLRRTVKHDKLGVNDAVINVQAAWQRKELVGAGQFLPLLDQVAGNDTFMHMSRERAAVLAESIRASTKSE